MKVVLSRKGFDAQYGGFPSPILPGGKMISLPIPVDSSSLTYNDLTLTDSINYYELMQQLDISSINQDSCCHLDPDLYSDVINRPTGWKAAFGQVDAAQSHLENQNVGIGDLFLFFGRFCKTFQRNGTYQYYPDKKHQFHALFGYLQIGEIIQGDDFPSWLRHHPHASDNYLLNKSSNTIYISRDVSTWDSSLPGAGTFHYAEGLRLTKTKSFNISQWDLPKEIFGNVHITYHRNPWRDDYFQSTARGQEFVIQDNNVVEEWAKEKIYIGLNNVTGMGHN
jgi:hypothetical protein